MVTTENLAEALRMERARLRLTLRQVGEAIGVNASTLCRVEGGKMPSARSYERIKDWIENKIEGDPR